MADNKCNNCGNENMEINKEWERAFDRLDKNIPAADLIWTDIRREGIPRYICNACGNKVMGHI